ncbi:MAG: anthranilate phosphoribosyltransferase [Dehalococcoidia bacterium]|nr:anthranilate phosphoribosyltransferase [Dehalococcoidia bacterium]
MIREAIARLLERKDLTEKEAEEAVGEIMRGEATPSQIGGFLVALRMKGETADEVTGSARAMRAASLKVHTSRKPLVDTCGTGGDGAGTFNISTTVALVVAGAGVAVAKHGNRSVSSSCGSADLLEELGVKVDLGPEAVGKCIDEVGIGFLFAPRYHPAMKHAAPIRKDLGVRTVFNILGPLTNPASAPMQLVGVYSPDLTELMARVLARLGATRAMVVHGAGGLDELSTSGPSRVTLLDRGQITTEYVDPVALGLSALSNNGIRGGTPEDNARATREVLRGEKGPRRDIVLLNAAAMLVTCGKAADYAQGMAMAADSIDSVRAFKVLAELARFTQGAAKTS